MSRLGILQRNRRVVLRCLHAELSEEEVFFVAAEAGTSFSVEAACSFIREDVLKRLLQTALGTAGGKEARPASLGTGRVWTGKPKRQGAGSSPVIDIPFNQLVVSGSDEFAGMVGDLRGSEQHCREVMFAADHQNVLTRCKLEAIGALGQSHFAATFSKVHGV